MLSVLVPRSTVTTNGLPSLLARYAFISPNVFTFSSLSCIILSPVFSPALIAGESSATSFTEFVGEPIINAMIIHSTSVNRKLKNGPANNVKNFGHGFFVLNCLLGGAI